MLRHVLALVTGSASAALFVVGCSGTTILDAPDPKACASGHGCPMVGCACGDGSVILDTTCELGKCLPPEDVCSDRCADYGGPKSAFASDGDDLPIPGCDTLCTRLQINGCELGCDTLFSTCRTPTKCSQAAASFWHCVTEEAVIACEDNAARVTGCDATEYGLCEP